ncbi:MAG: leucine-rich repeat protein [Lachnospiraceae bacterium]|nr:leucine-rich repeat protein [Lachnospiraceae bacterium]
MKKTIAKMMAAAMLVASMPAMALPTFTVDAAGEASGISVAAVKFTGSYATNDGWYWGYDKEDGTYKTMQVGTADKATTLKVNAFYGMSSSASNVWDTNIALFAKYTPDSKTFDSAIAGKTLNASSADETKDYTDSTGTVEKITTNSAGVMQITFKAADLASYQNNLLKGATAQTIKFYPFNTVDTEGKNVATFEIQVGESLSTTKSTKVEHVSTPDAAIQDATVEITTAGYAVLKSVSDTDKKVNMKDKDIEVSEIEISGIIYPIRKFDDQVLKKGTMKTITAKEIKNLGTGALRNCKKLRKVRMGSAKMRKIHSNAFYDCGKLKNIKINCKNLKAVGSKAFKALKKNCTISIKAKKAKYNAVVKMIKKSGVDKVKFKRV